MHHRLLLSLLAAIFIPCLGALASTDTNRERTAAAYLLALGRTPTAAEHDSAAFAPQSPLTERIEALRTRLKNDPALATAASAKAWSDAFGAPPTDKASPSGNKTYTELLQSHVQQLAAQPAEYRRVIERAYGRVAGRAPHDIEFEYWTQRAAVPYIALAACIEHWAQRNAPGLMSTTGEPSISIHSRQLVTLRVSPALAWEARRAAGLPHADGWASARERHVIIPGGQEIVAVGGIHFIAVGRD